LQGTGQDLVKSAMPVKNKRFFAEGNSAMADFSHPEAGTHNYKIQLQNAIRRGPGGW